MVLYRSEAALSGVSVTDMFTKSSPEQLAAGMAAWQAWHEKAVAALWSISGPPLQDKSTTVTAADSGKPGKTAITGYSILQAASVEDAVALMNGHPHFHMPGASIEILECVKIPGM